MLYDPYTNKETFEQRKQRQYNMSQEEKNETQEQLHYLDEVRKRIETNEPITEKDITNVSAIFEGKSVSLNRQEQNLNKESFQTHK